MSQDNFLEKHIRIDCDLECPELESEHKLYQVLDAANKNPLATRYIRSSTKIDYYWEADHFSLDRVSLYEGLTEEVQKRY